MKEIGIAEFRNNLKECMDDISGNIGQVYQIGMNRGVIVMSNKTLENLQQRHYVNMWAAKQFASLQINNYMTIANGRKTKDLTIDTIIALSKFFGLVEELLGVLAKPGPKNNAAKWTVSEYIKAAEEGKKLKAGGKFDSVYDVFSMLFYGTGIKQHLKSYTLLNFFYAIRDYLEDESVTEPFCMELNSEQATRIREIILHLSMWAADLMEFQTSACTQVPGTMLVTTRHILDWYQGNIGDLPDNMHIFAPI